MSEDLHYRMARAIIDRLRTGESVESVAYDYDTQLSLAEYLDRARKRWTHEDRAGTKEADDAGR